MLLYASKALASKIVRKLLFYHRKSYFIDYTITLYSTLNKTIHQNLGHEIFHEAMEYEHCVKLPQLASVQVIKWIRWEKPEVGWFRLNSDGSALGNPGPARSGGLIRNGEGEWVCGYARKIGTTTSFAAELWGLRGRILQCLNLQLPAIEIEIDAKSIVELLNNPRAAERVVSTLVDDCRYLISQLQQVHVKHYVREANRCANVLARLVLKQENDFLVFRSPLVDV